MCKRLIIFLLLIISLFTNPTIAEDEDSNNVELREKIVEDKQDKNIKDKTDKKDKKNKKEKTNHTNLRPNQDEVVLDLDENKN